MTPSKSDFKKAREVLCGCEETYSVFSDEKCSMKRIAQAIADQREADAKIAEFLEICPICLRNERHPIGIEHEENKRIAKAIRKGAV